MQIRGTHAKGCAHSVRAIELGEFHASGDESRDDLPRSVDDLVLGRRHVKASHVAQLFDHAGRYESLDGEGSERPTVKTA